MKKIIAIIILTSFLFGCSLANTPSGRVEAYLDQYNALSDSVLEEIDTTIANENLSNDNKAKYREVLIKQYENLKYEIKDEIVDGDEATVKAKITVYDLYSSDNNSSLYMNENINNFLDINGLFDNDAYNTYRLGNMLTTSNTIDYEVEFKLHKKNKEWVLELPDRITLEKIHGIYNYEND